MINKTLIFFIDAVREDYITEEYSPFLYNYKKNNTYMDVVSQLWYSSWIHPSIFTWKHQENHGKFLVYSYIDGNWPFKWMKHLEFIPAKIRQYFLAILKAPYYMINFWRKYYPNWYKKGILPIPASITPKVAPYFDMEDFKFENEMFQLLEKNWISISSQPDFYNPNYWEGVWLENWKITDNDIDYYFSYEIDPIGHYNGPNSIQVKEKMREIDNQISKLIKIAEEKYENLNIFIFSDHGMVEIIDNVDVKSTLDNSDLKLVDDYKVFYDSTMARFWVKNEEVKNKIIQLLSKVENLTYIDESLKQKYNINFPDSKWWELVFLAEPGYRIFPDYFAPVRFNTRWMHWYWPEFKEGKWIFMTNCFSTSDKDIHVIDFMPTMLKSMNLENLIPKNIDWKSII